MAEKVPVTFGYPLYRYDQVVSTQDVAREWAEQGAPPGTVVTARQMTGARGRLGRVWVHPPGANAAFTALAPAIPPSDVWQVSVAAGLAMCRAANAVAPGAGAKIRFPNDVYVQGRKLAGVLVETLTQADGAALPLVGIGMNVARATLPPEIAPRALSLEEATGTVLSVEAAQAALLREMSRCWEEWQTGGLAALLPEWHELLDRDALRTFLFKGEDYPCRVRQLDADGKVHLEAKDGYQFFAYASLILVDE